MSTNFDYQDGYDTEIFDEADDEKEEIDDDVDAMLRKFAEGPVAKAVGKISNFSSKNLAPVYSLVAEKKEPGKTKKEPVETKKRGLDEDDDTISEKGFSEKGDSWKKKGSAKKVKIEVPDKVADGQKLMTTFVKARQTTWNETVRKDDGSKKRLASQGGLFRDGGTILRAPRTYANDRPKQLLYEICVKLFKYLEDRSIIPTEVQCLYVDGRFVFAANEELGRQVLASFKSKEEKNLLNFLRQQPAALDDTAYEDLAPTETTKLAIIHQQAMENVYNLAEDLVAEDNEEELAEGSRLTYVRDTQDDPELLEDMFASLLAGKKSVWKYGRAAEAITWLNSEESDGGAFWCDPGTTTNGIHAEQLLTVLLARTRPGSEAVITGTMRTCVGCYLTILYAIDKLGLNLNKPSGPGGFWRETQIDGFQQLIDVSVDKALAELSEETDGELDSVHDKAAEVYLAEFKEFEQHIKDNFPDNTHASGLQRMDTDVIMNSKPGTQARRTLTPSLSDLEESFKKGERLRAAAEQEADEDSTGEKAAEIARKKKAAKKKLAQNLKRKSRKNNDDDADYVDPDYK